MLRMILRTSMIHQCVRVVVPSILDASAPAMWARQPESHSTQEEGHTARALQEENVVVVDGVLLMITVKQYEAPSSIPGANLKNSRDFVRELFFFTTWPVSYKNHDHKIERV